MNSTQMPDAEMGPFHNLPAPWKYDRIHNVTLLRTSNVNKKSEVNERIVQLCNYTDVYYNNRITAKIDFMQASASEAEIERFSLQPGDVVITKDSESPDDIGIPAFVAEKVNDLVCGYHLTICRPFESVISGRYLSYSLASRLSAYQFYLAANGVTRFGLTYQGTKNLRIAFPPVPEQKQIADFLDLKTAHIDALIAKKKELIEKLKEQRIAIITRAVTKGLDAAVPMRDSGVEWLGKVPKHWKCEKLQFNLREGVTNGLFKKRIFWGDGSRIVNVSDLYVHNDLIEESHLERLECTQDEIERYSAVHGDFFIVRSSLKLEGIGKSAMILDPSEKTVFECHIVRGRPDLERIFPRFLNLFLNSSYARAYFVSRANLVTMATIDQDKLKSLIVAVPTYNEQKTIAEAVDKRLNRIDSLLIAATRVIKRLLEYRVALITAATTGKIDVRNIAKHH
ncbi:MAG TPA: restriction endonuclease subunit S [Pyrinomonadaceae bacterium]|nr:restriction endonuclease subunit S [Pyrinomonadaceae bacterium]